MDRQSLLPYVSIHNGRFGTVVEVHPRVGLIRVRVRVMVRVRFRVRPAGELLRQRRVLVHSFYICFYVFLLLFTLYCLYALLPFGIIKEYIKLLHIVFNLS